MTPGSEPPGSTDTRDKPPPYDPREITAVENVARTEALGVLGWAREGAEPARRAVVFAGRSNAGAAALAVARHLVNYGLGCRIFLCGPAERLPSLVAAERAILAAMEARLDEELTGEHLARACQDIGRETCVVDGAGGDGAGGAGAAGREGAFSAAAARGSKSAGRVVRIQVPEGYQPPVPTGDDVLFSPDVPARTREEVRLLDSTAIEHYRIPGIVLMENAGWRAAREVYAALGFEPKGEVLVLAGPGNNGGDGFVLARHLAGWGVGVEVVLVAAREKVMDDAKVNLELAREAGVEIRCAGLPEVVDELLPEILPGSALVVDAILGTGLSGKVRGPAACAIGILNRSGARVIAVDTPSGLDANTGEVLGVATRAEKTVTFAFAKKGFFLGEGPARTGEIVVADISMPRALWARGP